MNDELRSKTFNKNFSVKYEILCQVEKSLKKNNGIVKLMLIAKTINLLNLK